MLGRKDDEEDDSAIDRIERRHGGLPEDVRDALMSMDWDAQLEQARAERARLQELGDEAGDAPEAASGEPVPQDVVAAVVPSVVEAPVAASAAAIAVDRPKRRVLPIGFAFVAGALVALGGASFLQDRGIDMSAVAAGLGTERIGRAATGSTGPSPFVLSEAPVRGETAAGAAAPLASGRLAGGPDPRVGSLLPHALVRIVPDAGPAALPVAVAGRPDSRGD